MFSPVTSSVVPNNKIANEVSSTNKEGEFNSESKNRCRINFYNIQEASKYLHMTSPLKIQEDQTMLPGNFSVRERLQHKKKSDTR